MKLKKAILFLCAAVLLLGLSACGKKADADVLMREAKTNANAIENCSASYVSELVFTANGKESVFKTNANCVYRAKPFALKSTQNTLLGSTATSSVSYTVTDPDGVWFYSNTGSGWQKTSAEDVGTTPLEQIDILRLTESISGQKYVRETEINSRKVHKIELTFQSNALRSTVETIVTATGMGQGSKTIVQTLLENAPAVYGYGYVDESTGQLVRLELDATEAVNKIFQSIDGSGIKVNVSRCVTSGDITNIGKAPAVTLPADAAAAQTVQAAG